MRSGDCIGEKLTFATDFILRLGSLTLERQPIKEKEILNSKLVKVYLKIDLVLHLICLEGLGRCIIILH